MHADQQASNREPSTTNAAPQRSGARAIKPVRRRRARLYYTMDECAAAWGWPVRRVRRHLQNHRAAIKRGPLWFTTKGLLRRHLAEESAEAIATLEAYRDEVETEGRGMKRRG